MAPVALQSVPTAVACTSSSTVNRSVTSSASFQGFKLVSNLFSASRKPLSASHSYSPLSVPAITNRSKLSTKANSRTLKVESAAKKVLIVNTNAGGHAVIGFYLSQDLAKAGHSVTILTVGSELDDKMKKQPFSRFAELRTLGVKTLWGNPSDIRAAVGDATFDVVLDNNGKDLSSVGPVIDFARGVNVEKFMFISSAGIYKTTEEPPHVEGDAVKDDSGHAQVERELGRVFRDWASFRPQYMTGSGNNKDCEEWFFDRLVRGRPVPVPGPGTQLTNISHVADLAHMLHLAIEDSDSSRNTIFNLVSQRAVSLDGLVRMCAKAAGVTPQIVHYDPKAAGVDVKKAFPFRPIHFYAEPRAAMEKLGWRQQVNLQEALNARFLDYLASGRDLKTIKFDLDDKILASKKVLVTV